MTRLALILGQGLMAFLPAFVVLVVAQNDSRSAAQFSLSFGIVGMAFTIFALGQRNYIVVRGTPLCSPRQMLVLRAGCMGVAAIVAWSISSYLSLPIAILAIAVCLKFSEGLLDLWLALRLKFGDTLRGSLVFAGISGLRAFAISSAVAVTLWMHSDLLDVLGPIAISVAVLVLVYVTRDVRQLPTAGRRSLGWRLLARQLGALKWFAASAASCSCICGMPRLIAGHEQITSATPSLLALSIAPAISLAYQAAWLTFAARLGRQRPMNLSAFALELVGIVVAVALLHPVWTWLAEIGYGLSTSEEQSAFAMTVVCSTVTFAGVVTTNLFKATKRPSDEVVAHAITIAIVLGGTFGTNLSLDTIMVIAGIFLGTFAFLTVSTTAHTKTRRAVRE